ncbi:unnamed protein product [Echinostoma caproni]|uniref:G protein-coupled receptor n=1 Tax=Echinostoma caproni TaxID=27848 RepID=A0A183AE86_9TREM|nr:unnamed protein product [Echinostoma caproni]
MRFAPPPRSNINCFVYFRQIQFSYSITIQFSFGNLFFLINVLRVFVKRLRESFILNYRKATKAAFMLMPLLGIANAVVLIEEPINPWGMLVITGLQRLLPCWQGLFVAVIYCFMNRQVSDIHRAHTFEAIYRFIVKDSRVRWKRGAGTTENILYALRYIKTETRLVRKLLYVR